MPLLIRVFLIIWIFFGVFFHISGQSDNTDSVRVLIQSGNLNSLEELEAYAWLSQHSSSPIEALSYGNDLLDLSKEYNNFKYEVIAYQYIGVAHRLMGDLSKAFDNLFKSAELAIESPDLELELANIYVEISTCYTLNGDSENALAYGQKTVDILKKNEPTTNLAITLLNIGYDYYLINELDSALSKYIEAEEIFSTLDLEIGKAYVTGNRALVHWKQKKHQQAKQGLFTAIEMLEPIGDIYGMADYYIRLGRIFWEEANYNNAIQHTTTGLQMARQEGLKEQIRDASDLLFKLYQQEGNFQEAIKYQSMFYNYKDSIQNVESMQKLSNLRTQFEVGQKQAEVDLLLEQKRSNQIIMFVGGLALVIVSALVILIFSFYREKAKLSRQLSEQKNSLEVLNQTKDKFFSIISHDLRGPVGVLRGLLHAIKRNWLDMDTEELKDILGQMENSADRLVNLLDTLLQWALQQKGHFKYNPENLSLNNILHDIVGLFEEMATTKGINVELKIEEEITIRAGKNAVLTIFRNLLNNAIKFTPKAGNIMISAHKSDTNQTALIEFRDNGVGIPEDKLNDLFKLNDRISTRGTAGESGLGLGLQLVYEFIDLNKGKIEVDSEEGKYTSFKVHLPLSEHPPS